MLHFPTMIRSILFSGTLLAILNSTSAFTTRVTTSKAPLASRIVADYPYLCPPNQVLFSSASSSDQAEPTSKPSILVLGGSGFVGSAICSKLDELGISFVAPRHDELDVTKSDAELKVADVCLQNSCTAVISTIGSINTPEDEVINAASGKAAVGARMGGCQRFVFIGNDENVRDLSKSIPFLKGYAAGKEEAEAKIRETFGPSDYCIIQPTFIYGGEDFALNPPRVASSVGQLADEVLGLYPIQALADALPGVLGVALSPPVSRERVAGAAINAALGLNGDKVSLSGPDIASVASRRPSKKLVEGTESDAHSTVDQEDASFEKRQELKRRLFSLGPDGQEEAAQILAELEELLPSSIRPVEDQTLNGRWDFVFDVEADTGSGLIRTLLEDPPPILGPVFKLNDVRMEISTNDRIDIIVNTDFLGKPCDLVLSTSLLKDNSVVDDGTVVLERFDGIKLGDMQLPIPETWKRSRPLTISYLDDDMIIASAGNEPHYLLRDK